MTQLRAPFPWFGGKSSVADVIWSRFGHVDHYLEPFAGSLATLLARPNWQEATPFRETVNDKSAYVANFWRAVTWAPDDVAACCDWPVNEVDLHAWHLWLVDAGRQAELRERCMADPGYYDPVVAGRWCWGLCQWIGSGWCSGRVSKKRPNVSRVHGDGILGSKVTTCRPDVSRDGKGIVTVGGGSGAAAWCRDLARRLRYVRVVCGDWTRITSPSCTTRHGLCGVFLDPPYLYSAGRAEDLYEQDDGNVANAVREWAVAHGHEMRICLAGYEGEHVMPDNWEVVAWKTGGGMGNQSGKINDNAKRERLWFSPLCLRPNAGFGLR